MPKQSETRIRPWLKEVNKNYSIDRFSTRTGRNKVSGSLPPSHAAALWLSLANLGRFSRTANDSLNYKVALLLGLLRRCSAHLLLRKMNLAQKNSAAASLPPTPQFCGFVLKFTTSTNHLPYTVISGGLPVFHSPDSTRHQR